MRCWWCSALLLGLAACRPVVLPEPPEPVSGARFQTEDTQALQSDPFANPGLLWVDRGEALFSARPNGSQPACLTCHADRLRGAAARLPRHDPDSGGIINLEMAINACRQERQGQPELAWESEALLSLTAYVATQSAGLPFSVDLSGPARAHWQAGQRYFYTRVGHLNLSCANCHEQFVGRLLRGDTLSQGQSVGYPAYRFEWQSLGSLHRRLQFCNAGVRADTLPGGHPTYLDLELYLAWRAGLLPLEAPAVRR
ncbi:MAG: sulfur oxidation c-type cytochrome SoxA [Pseudomonadota bacterium]